jgi:hypothetical protein
METEVLKSEFASVEVARDESAKGVHLFVQGPCDGKLDLLR